MPGRQTVGDVIDQINRFIEDFRAYRAQPMLPGNFREAEMRERAIKYTVQCLTEATSRLPETEKAKAPDFPWQRLVDAGNVIRHDYDDIAIALIDELDEKGHLVALQKAVAEMDRTSQAIRRDRRRRPTQTRGR
ncbi:MAG: HepT-like ribonuclease domain-containing protein [Pseudomonadota bacterium]